MEEGCPTLPSQLNPILLHKGHHLTRLLVKDAHHRVLHDGVAETLAEFRFTYWLVKGRQFVRSVIHSCVICRKLEGKPCQGNAPPPLPSFRMQQSRPFQATGVDFAGPLYVKSSNAGSTKVWLCLYTCCSTRAVHLDLVIDMTATTFLRCFRRFSARRGVPSLMISDNGKTFKSASKAIKHLLQDPTVKKHFSDLRVEWRFNSTLPKHPGGVVSLNV